MNVIHALDLDPIKVKLMHKESGEGWSPERANAVEFEYRRFLTLMKKFPNEQTAPLVDVDTFWHYHILDTMKYAADCEAVFGYFLHHFPYVGMRGEADEAELARIGRRMKELYEAEFGEDYLRAKPAFCGSPDKPANAQANAFCGSPDKQANAFCGSPDKQAYAFCGSPEEKVAFCGSPEKVLAAKAPTHPNLYSERPRLS
nr:glycine-rich domain-containing protein-like [uncultured Duganella sp.]